jgi:hypothetical protein
MIGYQQTAAFAAPRKIIHQQQFSPGNYPEM